MTLMDDAPAVQAAEVADALQAAYFRRSLHDEKAHLLAEIAKCRDAIAKNAEHGGSHATDRPRSLLRSVEAQVRYVDRLIGRLEQRFANYLGERDD